MAGQKGSSPPSSTALKILAFLLEHEEFTDETGSRVKVGGHVYLCINFR